MKVSDIVYSYRRYGLSIDRFFFTEHVDLVIDDEGGFRRFTRCLPGDAMFYAELMGRRGYDSAEKREFVYASTFIQPGDEVLDVGCGEGKFAQYCTRYKGVDTNPYAISAGLAAGRNVFLETMEQQPLDGFDVIVLFQVLEHVPDPVTMIRRAVTSLRAGGRLIVSVPNMDGFMGVAMNQELNYPPHHLTWWDVNSLSNVLTRAGLSVVNFWQEPLQHQHLAVFLFSLLLPRRDRHFDFSLRARLLTIFASLIARLAPRSIKEHRQAIGHTMLAVANKV